MKRKLKSLFGIAVAFVTAGFIMMIAGLAMGFEAPFTSRTNILLGSRSSASDRSLCISVNLQSGTIRDELNLVDNPFLLGRKVCIKGDIVEAYYGLPGLKNLTDFELQ